MRIVMIAHAIINQLLSIPMIWNDVRAVQQLHEWCH